jgi:hypothetical protein
MTASLRDSRDSPWYNVRMQRGIFKLVEECSGTGDLIEQGVVVRPVRYTLARFQGMLEGSGMPVPGLHRIEGAIDVALGDDETRLIGVPLTLRMEDGRALAITLASRDGRILTEGHGPSGGCSCC